MRNELSFAIRLLTLTACTGLLGCGAREEAQRREPAPSDAGDHAHETGHDHAAQHGGQIIDLGGGKYHAEFVHDDRAHKVGIYLLDASAQRAAPIDAASIAINCLVDEKPSQFLLPAAPQPGDPQGTASYFELVSEELCDGWDAPNAGARLNVMISGRSHVGDIANHDHGHGHSHAGDDALVWRKELDDQGIHIALGHHGQTLRAGHEVEPAVMITREGQPLATAKVFNSLLTGDGSAVLAEEVATVYEPPTSDEPAHYAQGGLSIPAGTKKAVIRFRIVFTDGQAERTIDVPVPVE